MQLNPLNLTLTNIVEGRVDECTYMVAMRTQGEEEVQNPAYINGLLHLQIIRYYGLLIQTNSQTWIHGNCNRMTRSIWNLLWKVI